MFSTYFVNDQSHKVKPHMFLSKRFANDSTDVQKFATIGFSPARLSVVGAIHKMQLICIITGKLDKKFKYDNKFIISAFSYHVSKSQLNQKL